MSLAQAIQITTLPSTWSTTDLPLAVEISRAFRLHTLQAAPQSFAMTYKQEVQFPDERWIQRLTNPNVVQFIATFADERAEDEAWKRTPWVGSVVLVRSTPEREKNIFDGGKLAGKDYDGHGEVLGFQLNAVFVDEKARGRGLGKMLLRKGLEVVKVEAREKKIRRVVVTSLANVWNEVAIGLYASQGFERRSVDWYTVGDERRQAVLMECVIDIDT